MARNRYLTLASAGVLALTLAGCATVKTATGTVQEPSPATMATIGVAVQTADALAFAYENLPSTTSPERVATNDAVASVNSAWSTLQAGVKAGQPVTLTAVESALTALESLASPAMVKANFARQG